MKISIITVSYNAVKTIEQTIISIINQTYKDFEYIIIDGGSTDGTVDVIKKYQDKIVYWVSEPDKGIYDAMNKGIDKAAGDWIYIIGADDCLVDTQILEKISEYFKEDIQVISGNVWGVSEKDGKQYIVGNNFFRSTLEDIQKSSISSHHQGMFVKTELMRSLHFDIKYKIGADYKLLLQLWFNKEYKVRKIKEIIAYFSIDGIGTKALERRLDDHEKIIKELKINSNIAKKLLLKDSKSILKRYIKNVLKKLGLDVLIHMYRNEYRQPHTCQWKFCRWCKIQKE